MQKAIIISASWFVFGARRRAPKTFLVHQKPLRAPKTILVRFWCSPLLGFVAAKTLKMTVQSFYLNKPITNNQNIIVIIIIKTSGRKSGKTKLFMNCLCNSTCTCETENWKIINSVEQPTVDCSLKPIQRSGVKHSVGKVIPQTNQGRQETP